MRLGGWTRAPEIHRIRSGLDEAHTELRELLTKPAHRWTSGSLPAPKTGQSFRQETGISIFFQCNCRSPHLGASEEMQMRTSREPTISQGACACPNSVRILLDLQHRG